MVKEVYVLNQKLKDGTICTAVFDNFKGCVKCIEEEFKEHNKEFTEQERLQLINELYCYDGSTEYFIEPCTINRVEDKCYDK